MEEFGNIPCLSVAESRMWYKPLGGNKQPILTEGLYHIKLYLFFSFYFEQFFPHNLLITVGNFLEPIMYLALY